jgi:hypothetical protein
MSWLNLKDILPQDHEDRRLRPIKAWEEEFDCIRQMGIMDDRN